MLILSRGNVYKVEKYYGPDTLFMSKSIKAFQNSINPWKYLLAQVLVSLHDILSCVLPQPILQYASAFDDELQEAHKDPVEEMAAHSVPGVAEEMPERAVEGKLVEETPHTSQAAHHGPYYYFYQGVCVCW